MKAAIQPYEKPCYGLTSSSGVYAFIGDDGEVLYVGASASLRYRISAHPLRSALPKCNVLTITCPLSKLTATEATLLRSFTTIHNRSTRPHKVNLWNRRSEVMRTSMMDRAETEGIA